MLQFVKIVTLLLWAFADILSEFNSHLFSFFGNKERTKKDDVPNIRKRNNF